MAKISTGSTNPIFTGNIVEYEHVRPILYALDGTTANDIIIAGTLDVASNTIYVDSTSITANKLATFNQGLIGANGITASNQLYIVGNTTGSAGIFNRFYVTASLTSSFISASTEVQGLRVTGSNILARQNLAFGSLGTIVTGSGSVGLIAHSFTQSINNGNSLTFGGSQFRDYLILGANSPRVGIGASTAVNTGSLFSGSFITSLPSFTPSAATLLVSSSDEYVMKVATNAQSRSFAISSSGQIGINTWTPREALDVQNGNLAVKNPTTVSGSIFYVENSNGRSFEVTNAVTNSILSVQSPSGIPIMEVGYNSTLNYFGISGNGAGLTANLSSSFNIASGSMSLPIVVTAGKTAGITDLIIVSSGNVTLPDPSTTGPGRYYIVKNGNAATTTITVTPAAGTINGIASLGPTSASRYVSDGNTTWYSL